MISDIARTIAENRGLLDLHDAEMRERMTATYRAARRRIEADLQRHLDWLATNPADPGSPFVRRRLEQLLADADRVMAQFAAEGQRIVEQAERMGALDGVVSARQMVADVLPDAGFFNRLPATALAELTAATGPTTPVRAILDAYSAPIREAIEKHVVEGMASGEGTRTILDRILRDADAGAPETRLEALVRTESMRAYRSAQHAAYDELNADGPVVTHWRWMATKGRRTCLACLAMDGRIFPLSERMTKAHVCCRCIATPLVDPELLGMSLDDQVQAHGPTGAEWFAGQPERVQQGMMPTMDAWEAYRDGEVTLRSFQGERHDPVWGTSVRVKSSYEVLGRRSVRRRPKPVRTALTPDPDDRGPVTVRPGRRGQAGTPVPSPPAGRVPRGGSVISLGQPVRAVSGGSHDAVAWAPSMSRVDADRFAAQGDLPRPLYHVTDSAAAKSIAKDGFELSRYKWGRVWGDGVYMSDAPASEAMYSSAFSSPAKIELRAFSRKTLHVDLSGVGGMGSPGHVAILDAVPGSELVYQRHLTSIRAANARYIQRHGTADLQAAIIRGDYIGDTNAAAFTRTLRDDFGFDALDIIDEPLRQSVGGSQVVVFDPKRVTVVQGS